MKHFSVKFVWKAAVLVALMLLLVGCAAVMMGLQDLKIGEYPREVTQTDGTQETAEIRTVLSLQGFVGSKNYQASKEWFEFSQTYEYPQEGELSLEQRMDYLAYGAYFQEQIDKIDEICNKYGLKLLGHEWMEEDTKTIFQAIGIDGIFRRDALADQKLLPGYYYSDGTFQVSGTVTLKEESLNWPEPIGFTIRCSMKESLDTVCISLPNIESYEQWEYTLTDGTKVLMALSPERGLIVADFADFFVTIMVMDTKEGNPWQGERSMDKGMFEAFADLFDLGFQPQRVDEEAAKQRYDALLAQAEAQQVAQKEAWKEATKNFDSRIRNFLEQTGSPEEMGYALRDVNGDGREELLIGMDGSFRAIYAEEDGQTFSIVPSDGTTVYHLCEDNVIAGISYTSWPGQRNYWYLRYDTPDSFTAELLTCQQETDQWEWGRVEERFTDGFDPMLFTKNMVLTPISQEKAQSVLESHPRIYLDTKPLMDVTLEAPAAIRQGSDWYEAGYAGYEEIILELLMQEPTSGLYQYALLDIDGNGTEELLLGWEDAIHEIYTLNGGQVHTFLWSAYEFKIYEGGMVGKIDRYPSGIEAYRFYRMDGLDAALKEYLRLDSMRDGENPWLHSVEGSSLDQELRSISQEEAEAIFQSYRPVEISLKPIAEYPLT